MLSARSPKYPALYDPESRVRFRSGRAQVSQEQAHALAERRFVDGILIGEFDDEGRIVNELPAKKWAAAQRGQEAETPADESGGSSEDAASQEQPADPASGAATTSPLEDDATGQGRRRNRRSN